MSADFDLLDKPVICSPAATYASSHFVLDVDCNGVKVRIMATPGPPMEMTEKKVTPVIPDESGGRKKRKPAPNRGASMLPKPVRNKMGFMQNGGAVKKAAGGGVNKSAVRSSSKKPL